MANTVLLYEDNESLRNSIVAMLQWNGAFEMVVAMPDATSIMEDIETLKPDVILMDIDMPPSNGVEALVTLRQMHKDLPVIMLTVFEDNENIVNSICGGASGYLLKKDIDQIVPAIKDVLDGGAPMTSSVARKVLQLFPGKLSAKIDTPESFTKRETEILNWLGKGYSYKMIASELQVGVETIRTHIKRIYKKLQVNSATEAVYKASLKKS
ncbi:MAG: response regulator transcription factor [Ferruginibacter sp.]